MSHTNCRKLRLKAGERVVVRSKDEILATLDKNGRLEELPFMPHMLQYCGQEHRVVKRAHKLCGTQHPTVSGTMSDAVVLEELRCDGHGLGGCEAACLFIWKEAWLKRVDDTSTGPSFSTGAGCTEADLWAATQIPSAPSTASLGPRYVCQATQMTAATKPLPFWSIPHFIEDYASGNQRLSTIFGAILFALFYRLAESGLGFGSALRWLYDKVQEIRGGTPYVRRMGNLPMNGPTPTMKLDLQPGELVRIKSHAEILDTVNLSLMNRGMGFHPELAPFCGKTFAVKGRVRKIINEKTGHLMELKNPCIVLEGLHCGGFFTKPLFCSRDCHPYWREIWLERVNGDSLTPESDHALVANAARQPR
jgi:predicted DNA-binding antitoxin AbrB/MazE fold protein